MPRVSKVRKVGGAMQVLSGVAKHLEEGQTYRLGGTPFSKGEIAAVFQAVVDAIREVDARHAALDASLAKERAAAARAHEVALLLKTVVHGLFGPSAKHWADFGWEAPKKRGPKTVKGKVEGAAKARATRAARHTMGTRQRKKIRG